MTYIWAFFGAFWPRRKASRVCVPKFFDSECRESLLYQFTLGVIEMCLASPVNFTRKPPRLTLNEFNGENSFQEREKFENSLNSLCAALGCINFSSSRPTRNRHFRLLIFAPKLKEANGFRDVSFSFAGCGAVSTSSREIFWNKFCNSTGQIRGRILPFSFAKSLSSNTNLNAMLF